MLGWPMNALAVIELREEKCALPKGAELMSNERNKNYSTEFAWESVVKQFDGLNYLHAKVRLLTMLVDKQDQTQEMLEFPQSEKEQNILKYWMRQQVHS